MSPPREQGCLTHLETDELTRQTAATTSDLERFFLVFLLTKLGTRKGFRGLELIVEHYIRDASARTELSSLKGAHRSCPASNRVRADELCNGYREVGRGGGAREGTCCTVTPHGTCIHIKLYDN